MEGRNVDIIMGESPKQGLTSSKDLTIELPEGREFSYRKLDLLTNLTYSLICGLSGACSNDNS